MRPAPLPVAAAWQHIDARSGFEVLFTAPGRLEGHTTAVEDGAIWAVSYRIELDPGWRTIRADVTGRSPSGTRAIRLERTDGGRWTVDGTPAPELDGCADVDLESSAVTNTLPIHRADFPPGEPVACPAAYVRADLSVQRLEQTYTARAPGRFDYASPAFDFAAELRYDEAGLIVDYPGIARRVA